MSRLQSFAFSPTALLVASSITLAACGGGAGGSNGTSGGVIRSDDAPITPMSEIRLRVSLPTRIQTIDDDIEVVVTAGGDSQIMEGTNGEFSLAISLPMNRNYPLFLRVQRTSDDLILASAQSEMFTDAEEISFAIPPQLFSSA